MISTVALQIGSFTMTMTRQGCLDNTLVISPICFSSSAVVRIYDNDAHVWILNQETGQHNQENLKQRYKFIIELILAIKPSFYS
jgi:H+/gluconate symporter-like permease